MHKAYQTMRDFWLDVKNLQHKKEVPQLGEHHICIAGVEMAAEDPNGRIKHLMIAASTLGNASVYFENNSPSGIGGFTGGAASGPVRDKSLRMLQAATAAADQLTVCEHVTEQTDPTIVVLFAISAEGHMRQALVKEEEVRQPQHPLYAFFAYTQQLLGAFRQEQEIAQAASAEQATPHKSASSLEEK